MGYQANEQILLLQLMYYNYYYFHSPPSWPFEVHCLYSPCKILPEQEVRVRAGSY